MGLDLEVKADGSAALSIWAVDAPEFAAITKAVPDLVAVLRDDARRVGELRALTEQLARATTPLADAVAAAGGSPDTVSDERKYQDFLSRARSQGDPMNPLDQAFADLATQVAATSGAEDSATVLIPGLVTQLEAALAAGNPTQQIAKVRDVIAAMKTHTDPLAAAVAAVPPAPPPAPTPAP